MGGDPFYDDEAGRQRLFADVGVRPLLLRVHWLKIGTGIIALAIVGAILVVWRWSV